MIQLKYIFILLLVFIISCKETTKSTSFDTTPKSIEQLYEYFNNKGKSLTFAASTFKFGNQRISDTILNSLLKFRSDLLNDTGYAIYRKAAFKTITKGDTLYFFLYGFVTNSELKELRIRSIKKDKIIDDQQLINFRKASDLTYDYLIGDYIHVSKINKKGQIQSTFYTYKNGLIRLINSIPKNSFHPIYKIKAQIALKRLLIYDNCASKKMTIPSGKEHHVIGSVIKTYGSKTSGRHLLVKIDEDTILGTQYISLKINTNQENLDYYYPMELFLLDSDSLVLKDDGFSQALMPAGATSLFKKHAFIEIVK